jgi:predicted Zn-dependent peptidase
MNRPNKCFIYFLVVSVLLLGTTGMAARTVDKLKYPPLNEIKMPDIEKVTLDNGIRVYLLEDHELPLVRASVRMAAGSYLEPADKIGLASLVGQVMRTGGTARMSGDEIDETLESLGASVETGFDNIGGNAGMNILSDYVDTGLEILADVLRTPQFAEDKIGIAKSAERTNISSRNDEPFTICIREFKKAIYGDDSPYARHTEYATVNSITRDDMLAFHKQYVTPENIQIALWGDFNKAEMLQKIDKYFGDWSRGSGPVPAPPPVDYKYEPGIYSIVKDDITQSSVLVGHIGGLTGDPDYFAITVANTILGSSEGGRIFNEVRSRRGLAYSTAGNYSTNIAYPGIFYAYAITKFGSTAEAIETMQAEIRRMQTDPPTPQEMKRAKDSFLNSFVFQFDSKGEIINRMMTYDYYNFPQDFLFTLKDKIENVTPEDVVDVAKRRFHPDELKIVVVGMPENYDKPLSSLGEVTDIDITIPSGQVTEEIAEDEESLAKGMELINKAAQACGGVANFAKINATSSKQNVTIITPQGNMTIGVKSIFVLPDREKEIISTPMGEMISVIDGETGWMAQGPNVADIPAGQVADGKQERFRNQLLLFRNCQNPDFKAIYVGEDKIGNKSVNIVNVVSLDGKNSYKLALDANSGLPVGKMYFGETMMGPGNLTVLMDDYRNVSGVKIPFATSVESEGNKVMDIVVESYEINPTIPANTFDRP